MNDPWKIIKELESDNSRLFKEGVVENNLNNIEFQEGLSMCLDPLITFGVKQVPESEQDGDGLKWDDFKKDVDLLIEMDNGKIFLVEIKPKKETAPPKKPKRKTKRYVNEQLTYIKNNDKWEAANKFAEKVGWEFQVWTEETLKNIGIKVL